MASLRLDSRLRPMATRIAWRVFKSLVMLTRRQDPFSCLTVLQCRASTTSCKVTVTTFPGWPPSNVLIGKTLNDVGSLSVSHHRGLSDGFDGDAIDDCRRVGFVEHALFEAADFLYSVPPGSSASDRKEATSDDDYFGELQRKVSDVRVGVKTMRFTVVEVSKLERFVKAFGACGRQRR